jgi:hypothetical protein
MATFHIPITCDNIVGSTNFKVKYRLMGDPIWTSYLIASATEVTIMIPADSPANVLLDNRIYDFQVQNLNGADNALSLISESIGFTAPGLLISPTSETVGYSFENLSVDIDSYTVQITTADAPGVILQTHILTPTTFPEALSDTFTGLLSLTAYRLIITPVANQFSQPFVYTFATEQGINCPAVPSVTASLT